MATTTQTALEVDAHDIELRDVDPKAPVVCVHAGPSSAGRALSTTSSRTGSADQSVHELAITAERPKLSTLQAWIVITQLCANSFINSFGSGLLLVCLPTMARDLNLAPNLLLWPNSVASLTAASSFLIMGSVADVIGPRRMNIPGSFLQSVFIIATGFSKNGGMLIALRALEGIASAIYAPSARSILSTNLKHGRLRNFGFSTMSLAFPLGAGLGLVFGGLYIDVASWRVGYWSSGGLGLACSLLGTMTLPKDEKPFGTIRDAVRRLSREIDWLGVGLASSSAALLSYVFATLSADVDEIRRPASIVLLCVSVALIPLFALWMHRQDKLQRPAVIPNSLWKDEKFASICVMIGLVNGAQVGLTLFCSLFFQEVQHLSAFDASLRLIPQAVTGILCCLFIGSFIHQVSALVAVILAMVLSSLSPLLMAITNPSWPYWYSIFWAQVLGPLSIDVTFIVGFLVISEIFSGKAQARGAAVFSTFAQLGVSMWLCIMSVVSANVSSHEKATNTLLQGYRASFWMQFASFVLSAATAAVGLRKLGKVGLKRD